MSASFNLIRPGILKLMSDKNFELQSRGGGEADL